MALRLARWLGPWAEESRAPARIERREQRLGDGERSFPAYLYRRPGPLVGSLLLVPGLHYLGPLDPRLDRFARILADAGLLVLSPLLPDFTRLLVRPSLASDTALAFEALLAQPERPKEAPPGVISISFGSYPAIALAGSPAYRDRVGGLLSFGGFASFEEAIRFCLEGGGGLPHDPLNRPVVYLNLLEIGSLEGAPADPLPLAEAWRAFVAQTWGRPELKARERYEPIALALAGGLDPEASELFLRGCGLLPGGTELALRCLDRAGDAFAFLDPRRSAAQVRGPVHVVHGRDDDVIPYTEAEALRAFFPARARAVTHLTGLYAHTGHADGSSGSPLATLRGAPQLAKELATMLHILRAMARVGALPPRG